MLLFPVFALAAETVPDRGVVVVSASTLINAGEPGTLDLENVGARPVELTADRASFGGATTQVVVAPRGKSTVPLRYDGACGPSDWGPCVTGSVRLTAPGGTLEVEVEVLPPRTGMLGILPARLYWDPSGPPPPGAQLGLGSLFGSGAAPRLPELQAGPETTVPSRWGDVRAGLSYPRGAASNLGALESALSTAAGACDARTATGTLDISGRVGWAADGRITGIRVDRSIGASERCVVVGLLAARVGAGPGESGFWVGR